MSPQKTSPQKIGDDEPLDQLLVRLCEALPFDLTLYEKDGFCKKPSDYCDHCKLHTRSKEYFCFKKTYTFDTYLNKT